jgi:hypothetical protein
MEIEMRVFPLLAIVLVTGACASAGPFPQTGDDPAAAIANAERLIGEAQQAGADSVVADVMGSARQHLAAAQVERRSDNVGRAVLHGREAAADAAYAKAAAERAAAEKARAAAQAALDSLGSGGAR